MRTATSTSVWTKRGAEKALQRKTGVASRVERSPSGSVVLTWQDAERLACDWMRRNGYRDAQLTPSGADGGVDVVAGKAIAQVKFHAAPVGLAEVQRMYGLAQSSGKAALFFSSAGFTAKALAWSRTHRIETYVFPPVRRVP